MASSSSEKAVSLMGSVGTFAWLLIVPGAIVGVEEGHLHILLLTPELLKDKLTCN